MTPNIASRSATGGIPQDVRCAADYARLAPEFMSPALFAHVDGGAGQDMTSAANLAAFSDCAIVPRVLRPVHGGDTRYSLAGITRPHPILLAPIGWQEALHPQAERATAMAAAATETCLIASTMSSLTMEEIAVCEGSDRWFQLYVQPDRAVTLDLVRRAETAGYTALVVTVDAPIQLPSHKALAAGYEAPADPANLREYPVRLQAEVARDKSKILHGFMRDAPVWEHVAWLARETSLPLWIKGVMHEADAREAIAHGAAGVIVSNHGGRALDGAPSSLSRLPAIRAALGTEAPILFDGGVRSGTDIFKAIALGADAVLIGRLQAFALAVAGALGVAHMIKLLREELEACMALAGCATLNGVRGAEIVDTRQGWGTRS
jgi:4-hydroxymandelate oxidase